MFFLFLGQQQPIIKKYYGRIIMNLDPARYILITLFLFFFNLHGLKANEPEAGRVIPQITCLADSTHHYSLYLPSYFYTADQEAWPVIYAFDAAGRGSAPVGLFAEAAEKYGYIIAGSNISENGPWEPILKAAEMMIKDTEVRFAVDKARRYTAGFSGGARVASALAILYGKFEGVIGCGAGFSPNYPPNFDMEFCYIGLIGNRDFNYQEMMNLDEWLGKYRIDHYTLEYPGSHEWPPSGVLTDAVTWLQFKAMKNDLIWIDYGMREDFYDLQYALIQTLIEENLKYDAYQACRKTLAYLHGIRNLKEIESLADELWRSQEVMTEIGNKSRILEEERKFYKQYQETFSNYRYNYEDSMTPIKPVKWWKEQLKIANNKIDRGPTPADILMGRRMIDFMWRSAYMNYESVQGTEFQAISRYYLDIWAALQPDAISPYFFLARYHVSEGKYDKAFDALNVAVRNGLNDRAIVEGDPWLTSLTTLPEYERLVRRMDENH